MTRAFQFRLDEAKPVPFEREPSDSTEGNPQQAVVILHRSEDANTVAGIFRSTTGKFTVAQVGDEWTLIRKGRVKITADDGSCVDCRPGDVYALSKGGEYVFEVMEDLEDYFVMSNPEGLTI